MSIRYLQISLNTPNPPPPSTPAPPKKIKIKKLVFLLGISVDQREIEEILLGGGGGGGGGGPRSGLMGDVQMPNLATISPFVSRHGREIREIRFYKKSRPNLWLAYGRFSRLTSLLS